MPTQISAHDLTKSYAGRLVLDGVTCAFPPGGRTGIIGENGSGKSTLLRLLAGVERPDSGEVVRQADGGIGHLPQDGRLDPALTTGQVIDVALAGLRALERRMRRLEAALADGDETGLAEYGDLQTAFELRGGYETDARVERALHGLGLRGLSRDRRVGTLSGGQRARLRFAALLSAAPEVLLLDEPTNHLDDNALTWLQDHLATRRGTTLVVSHDRLFLERVADGLLEVDADRKTVVRYGTGYAGYLAERAAARRRWAQAHAEWEAELAALRRTADTTARRVAPGRAIRDGNKMAYDRRGGRVQQSVASRVRNAEERIRRLLADPVPPPPEPLRFAPGAFATPDGRERSGPVLAAEGVAVTGRLAPVGLALAPGERLLVTGPNGTGKSTLLDVLAGVRRPDAGRVLRRGRVAYLPQDPEEGRPGETLLAAFARGRAGTPDEHAERLLSYGLFAPGQLDLPVTGLSAGQRQRLALARLLAEPADVLLLDEPTNHLSPGLVEELETALDGYGGALVVVSHDRLLRRRWRGARLELAPQDHDGPLSGTKETPGMTEKTPTPALVQLGDPGAGPYGITRGPDDALWMTLVHSGEIARLGADGRVDRYGLGAPGSKPTVIAPGPDGALWFSRYGDHRIGRITVHGEASSYALPEPESGPYGLVAGPDGAVWFTEMHTDRIGRIDREGRVTEHALPVTGAYPSAIAAGPDGALWFTLNQANAVGRLAMDGGVTVVPLPTEGAAPVGIARGGDGALWFVEIGAGQIGRVTVDGKVTEYALPDRSARPHALVADPSGVGVWFTQWAAGSVGFLGPDGEVREYALPPGTAEPHGLAFGADGGLYVALESGQVARLDLRAG